MIESLLHTFARDLDYLRRGVADLSPQQMASQPAPGMNHPAWVLGHLAWTTDLIGGLLGLPPAIDPSWTPIFDNQSTPEPDPSRYPGKAALLAALEAGHERVAAAARSASPEQLAAPLPIEDFRKAFPTVGDALVFLLTSHEAVHQGQLSAWRRASGLPRI